MATLPLISFLFLVFSISQGSTRGTWIEDRIVNGEVAAAGEFPWQVSLRGPNHFCGGTLVSNQHVLTAAHCVSGRNASDITVFTGTTSLEVGGEEQTVRTIFIHQNYSSPAPAYHLADVALLVLDAPITESPLQRSIALAIEDVPEDVQAVVSGWGRTSVNSTTLPNELQKLNVTILNSTECQYRWGAETVIQPDHLCTVQANDSGVCNGDSGGGLIFNNQVVGIVSWANPCALGYPDVYTRVYNYIFWIGSRIHNVELMTTTTVLPETTTADSGQHSLTHANHVLFIISVFYLVKQILMCG